MEDVNKILSFYFDRDFFFHDQSVKNKLIEKKIEEFPQEIEEKILESFQSAFPDSEIENWSQLYLRDRCLRFLAVNNKFDNRRYIFLVSIFGYFAVYSMTLTQKDALYYYGDRYFINSGESTFCDMVYKICVETLELKWLDKDVLEQRVDNLSIVTDYASKYITVADALFLENYNI